MLAGFITTADAQQLAGTTPVTTGGSAVVPTLETANPGTFLAQATFAGGFLNFSNFSVTNFTMQEAVYRNAAGSVDFYFQIQSTFSGSPSSFGYLIPEGDDIRRVLREFEGIDAPQPPPPGTLFGSGCRVGHPLLG